MGRLTELLSSLGSENANVPALLVVLYLLVTGVSVALARVFIFYREDRFFPKIEFLCDLFFHVDRGDVWIVEVVCVVRNRGVSGHRVRDLAFRLHGLHSKDRLAFGGANINNQIEFPHDLREGRWEFRPDMNKRVEPGTAQFYRHVTAIDKSLEAVVVHASMTYRHKRFWWLGKPVEHTCNRLVTVPTSVDEAKKRQSSEILRLEFQN